MIFSEFQDYPLSYKLNQKGFRIAMADGFAFKYFENI